MVSCCHAVGLSVIGAPTPAATTSSTPSVVAATAGPDTVRRYSSFCSGVASERNTPSCVWWSTCVRTSWL